MSESKLTRTMSNPHAILVPFPVQGHIIAYMELSHRLVARGFKITFVNTEFNHKRIMTTLQKDKEKGQINPVSIQDGLADEDRNNLGKLSEAMISILPEKLEEIIKNINSSDDEYDVTCIISDMGWALTVGEKMGIHKVAFWTTSAGMLALIFNIPKLIEEGVINPDGTLVKNQLVQLSPEMPTMNAAQFVWLCIGDLETQKICFRTIVKSNQAAEVVNWHICNSVKELEPAAFGMVPEILSIGPLHASSQLGQSLGHFWPEDSTCLNWLDQQPARSVIYVAFGSITIFNQTQFQELALGLELSSQPFLWVVRPDMTNGSSDAYPEGFQDRVSTRGQMVGWAPQQRVLSHPSIACFLSHCGWNSTLESISNGVPFLCWPYFADQFLNQSYICDVWKVGLELNRNGKGIITRDEIKEKVNELLGDEGIRTRILELKEVARKTVQDGGSSSNNFDYFVNEIKK